MLYKKYVPYLEQMGKEEDVYDYLFQKEAQIIGFDDGGRDVM